MGFAETFKALSDPIRREILMMLRDGSMSAGEIGSHFDMTGATISYHLKILKKAELIFEKKEKNYIYYTLNTSVVEEIMLWLSELKLSLIHIYYRGIPISSKERHRQWTILYKHKLRREFKRRYIK